MSSARLGDPQSLATSTCCCTGTGTGSFECDCACCPTGYWTEFELTVSGITALSFCTDCALFDGTWTLKYRGNCTWCTDEVYANSSDCFDSVCGDACCYDSGGVTYCPMWSLVMVDTGTECGCLYSLCGAFGTFAWNAQELCETTGFPPTVPATVPAQPTFCVDGGELVRVLQTTAAFCSGPDTLTVTPTGVFIPCP